MSEKKLSRRGFIGGLGAAAMAGTAISLGIGMKDAEAAAAPNTWDKKTDVVVVGGGLAGLCAAVEASQRKAKVILLDAFTVTGGNSALSTAWFNAADSSIQRKLGIKDSADDFYKDSMDISENKRDPAITRVVADKSSEAIEWLKKQGIVFLDLAEPAMGSPKPRAIQAQGYGKQLVTTLTELCKKQKVEVINRARVLNIYRKIKDGKQRVAGVEADIKGKKVRIGANAVIIATGGFMNNKKLVERFCPQWSKTLVASTPTNVGDGIIMAAVEGADAINMDRALVTPTLEVKTKIYLTSGALSGGAILINEKGQRFTDELKGYTETSIEMLKQEKVFEVMVEKCHPKVTTFIEKKILERGDSVAELAQKLGIDAGNLEKTLETFNQATAGKASDPFGRKIFREKLAPPLYAMQVSPVLLLTLGGLKVDTGARVLNIRDEVVLQGLYAVGEVAGGYIDYGYRTGDSLMYCTVFGIIAGKNAAQEKKG